MCVRLNAYMKEVGRECVLAFVKFFSFVLMQLFWFRFVVCIAMR